MLIDILSLPRRHNLAMPEDKDITLENGLPINSLPGWESIPLNCKLPMLKCPGNQVIFTKNKIGHRLTPLKQDFDTSGYDKIPEYNSLHDSNLKSFYANEKNLKRLRENGEITEDNDVICTLKDFNEYREQLHKQHLFYMVSALKRIENEQQDRLLILNAENITTNDHNNLVARQHSHAETRARKAELDALKAEQKLLMLQKTQEKFCFAERRVQMVKALREHQKTLNQVKMQHHWEVCADLERKHLINLKKLFQFKKDRLKKNMELVMAKRYPKDTPEDINAWHQRLQERVNHQLRMKDLLEEVNKQRRTFVENHYKLYQAKWTQIKREIYKRSQQNQAKSPLYKKKRRRSLMSRSDSMFEAELQPKLQTEFALVQKLDREDFSEPQQQKIPEPVYEQEKRITPIKKMSNEVEKSGSCLGGEYFDQLLDNEMCAALKLTMDIDFNEQLPFEMDDPIYKAAKFIQQQVIAKFTKDLSCDQKAVKGVSERVSCFLDEAKQFVMSRAIKVILSYQESPTRFEDAGRPLCDLTQAVEIGRPSCVSFSHMLSTIGKASYEINPFTDIKNVFDRTPTPAGSLASLVVESNETIKNKTKTEHLCRNDIVFIEHYLMKFKRELIVDMGKLVFAAIRCHISNKIMDVNLKLIDVDKKFLIKKATKAILSRAKNPLDFDSALKFCTSVLASQIIWDLQKELLRPARDPRHIVMPRSCGRCNPEKSGQCLFCLH